MITIASNLRLQKSNRFYFEKIEQDLWRLDVGYCLWCIFSSQALPTYLNYLRLVVDRLTLVLNNVRPTIVWPLASFRFPSFLWKCTFPKTFYYLIITLCYSCSTYLFYFVVAQRDVSCPLVERTCWKFFHHLCHNLYGYCQIVTHA